MNDKVGDWILCKHGLKQGGPLLPFLSIIAADPLCRMLIKAAAKHIFGDLEAQKYFSTPMIFLFLFKQRKSTSS